MNNAEVLIKFKGDTEDVEKKTSGLGKSIKSLAGSVGKAVTGASVAATAAIAGLTKSAVDSYSDYEQLIGGVETLFAESEAEIKSFEEFYGKSWEELQNSAEGFSTTADNVIGNALDAFKTAGVSANEYMEGVNSFAAALLQATSKNSWEAMEIADMAFIDMADNANKMGTSMEAIQTAYQGFAKQNYTMLDNLKLGYGGTKTEMERLLADAEKISGVKYDISNLADVYNAIHVIQEEMGIAGTTAKEASTTISGSAKSMKAAFKNFLTSLASGKGIEGTFNKLLESAMTFGENLMPVIETTLISIVDMIPTIVDKILPILPGLFDQMFPTIITGAVSLVNGLIEQMPQLIYTMLPSILGGVVSIILGIINSLPTIIEMLTSMLPTLIDAMLEGLLVITYAIIEQLPVIIPMVIDGILGIIPKLLEYLPDFINAGYQLIAGIVAGIINAVPTLFFRIGEIGWKMIETLKNALFDIFSGNLGKRFIEGLWNGIKSAKDWIINKVKGIGSSILGAVKGIFGIHSPSKEFAIIGEYNMLGLEKGMEDMQPEIQKEIDGMFDLSPSMNGSMNNILSPNIINNIQVDVQQDPLGQLVNNIKTFSGGAKNDFNYGQGV